MNDVRGTVFDVLIIGAGWTGLVACKSMLEHGQTCLVLEKKSHAGGVWRLDVSDRSTGGVIPSTRTTSSKTITEMSDFPMPEEYPHFPTHTQILTYLHTYMDAFDLHRHIQFETGVTSVEKIDNYWHVSDQNGTTYRSRHLVICSGVHQHPNLDFDDQNLFRGFQGEKHHNASLKDGFEQFSGKNVLIYGSGETASDMAVELSRYTNKLYVSSPNGQWIVNRYFKGEAGYRDIVLLDHGSSVARAVVDPTDSAFGAAHYVQSRFGICGHDIKEWATNAPYQTQFFNKNNEIVHLAHIGLVDPKPAIKHCDQNKISFSDGTEAEVDTIVFCTGYKTKFDFLAEHLRPKHIYENFKLMFHAEDQTLVFCGFARPIAGSIPAIAELQAICAAKVFAGEITMPDRDAMDRIIAGDRQTFERRFASTTKRISGLVDFPAYMEFLAIWAGLEPDYKQIRKTNFSDFLQVISAPHNNCKYLLNQDRAYKNSLNHIRRQRHPFFNNPFTYVILTLRNFFPIYTNVYSHKKISKIRSVVSQAVNPYVLITTASLSLPRPLSHVSAFVLSLPLFLMAIPIGAARLVRFLARRRAIRQEIARWQTDPRSSLSQKTLHVSTAQRDTSIVSPSRIQLRSWFAFR